MVEYSDTMLDGVFGALSDPTRRALLEQLRDGPATVGELADPHDITLQGVSKHLKKLEQAGLIRRRRDGREVRCEILLQPMQQAATWLDEQRRFWTARLDRLDEVLKTSEKKHPNTKSEKDDGTDDD